MFSLTPYWRNAPTQRSANIMNLFEEFFNDSFFNRTMDMVNPIKTDIKENENEFILEAELPGISKEDIKINIENDVLAIGYEIKEEKEEAGGKKENYIKRERRAGSFLRSYNVDNIEQEAIAANYENGVLRLTLPKKTAKPSSTRSIEIN